MSRPFHVRIALLATLVASAMMSLDGGFALADDRAVPAAATNTAKPQSSTERIGELIRELGSPQFTVRRTAATELHKIGPEAFDQLHAATDDADPEIAASARYLLRQITVNWTRAEDPATVRRLLRNYNDLGDSERQAVIQQLSTLENRDGIPGLCRIARFDRSPRLSRTAALAVVRSIERSDDERPLDPAIIGRELGESTRVASKWLRQYQLQMRDPGASVAGWQTLIDEESCRLDANLDETSSGIVLALLWNLADVERRLGDTVQLVVVSDRIIALSGDNSDLMIAKFLQWLVDNESWESLNQFAAKNDARIRQTKQSLYLVALAHAKQNQTQQAETLAEQASRLTVRSSADQMEGLADELLLAGGVAGWGQFDWAVREYKQAYADKPIESPEAMASRVFLSSLMQDYEKFGESAEVIEPLAGALEKNRELLRSYANLQAELAQYGNELALIDANAVSARHDFMLASQFERDGDYQRQREHLLKAIEHDPKDADVLIAMYRAPQADEAWKQDTKERIEKLSREVERQIDDDTNNPIGYNQWAWLIANTEGDKQKAVRYSRRSLELMPNTASFLDTLGRCYYAVGDYKRAVKYQRRAVELIPNMQVMQRQLKLFEEKLAEQEKSAATQ